MNLALSDFNCNLSNSTWHVNWKVVDYRDVCILHPFFQRPLASYGQFQHTEHRSRVYLRRRFCYPSFLELRMYETCHLPIDVLLQELRQQLEVFVSGLLIRLHVVSRGSILTCVLKSSSKLHIRQEEPPD